jgi:oxygen-independent coproporphyrinogen-3 oxidase
MCRFRLAPAEYQGQFGEPLEERFQGELARLEPFTEDRILEREAQGWRVTELGRVFLRNVAMVFDAYLQAPRVGATFSQTV